jgi:hypothetical protein
VTVTDHHPPEPTAPAKQQPPRQVEHAIRALYVVAAIHLLALVLVATHHGVLTAAVAADHPGWSPQRVDKVAASLFQSTLVPHIVLPVVFLARGRALRSGRHRTRTVITVLLGLQLLAHATLPLQLRLFPGYGPWIVGVQAVSLVFEAATLGLLWGTAPAREFFARSPGRG